MSEFKVLVEHTLSPEILALIKSWAGAPVATGEAKSAKKPVKETPADPIDQDEVKPDKVSKSVKTTEKATRITLEELRLKCKELTEKNEDNRPTIKALMKTYGAKTLPDMKQEDYAEFKEKLDEI